MTTIEWDEPRRDPPLQAVTLHQFRCFQNKKFVFGSHFHLVVGENGSGKTALLDGIACLLAQIVLRVTGEEVLQQSIQRKDVRLVRRETGEGFTLEPQGGSLLAAQGFLFGRPQMWGTNRGPEASGDAQPSAAQQPSDKGASQSSPEGLSADVMPVFAFYGTDRSRPASDFAPIELIPEAQVSRLDAYASALSSSTSPERLTRALFNEEFIAFQSKGYSATSTAVRSAIASCIENATNVRFDAKEKQVVIWFGDSEYQLFNNLSHGQRSMLAMVGDIATRAAVLNGQLGERVLEETPGIVLIDELDLHLHPRWQRRVIADLRRVFPKIQFIATTHSPFLIQALKPGELINLHEEPKEAEYTDQSVEDITENVMGVELPQKSQRYLDMAAAAEEYYSLLREPDADPEKLRRLERQLDEASFPFSDDPAFQALLKLEREAKRGKR